MNAAWHNAPWEPREWQRQALPRIVASLERNPLCRAVMGSGKSILIWAILKQLGMRAVVLTPTQKLVRQLAATFREGGLDVGTYYADSKTTTRRVTVCCNDSLRSLADAVDPPDLFIVDEAHRSECDQVKDVLLGGRDARGDRQAGWMPRHRVGFTATPYRSTDSERLTLFDNLVFDYGPAQAIRDGVVVPPKVVHYTGAEGADVNGVCVEMIVGAKRDGLGPGLVDAKSIADAMEFAAELEAAGIRCKPVHSKLHESTNEARILALKRGDLDCLVHVQMLAEGVDLPWLRWLCCRRPIASKVLFAQYVGRGLRAHAGKEFCTIFDPHDLFGALSLDYEAVIGMGDDEEDIVVPALKLLDELKRGAGEGETLNGVPVRFVPPVVSYVRRLHLEFQCRGLLSMRLPDMQWRNDVATRAQLSKLSSLAGVLVANDVPPEHAKALRIAGKMALAETLSRGTTSDLISILMVLRAYQWPGAEVEAA